jgi:hypothetical protein
MFIKKRSDGEYDILESHTVKGKTKRKIIMHLGRKNFWTHALRLTHRDARAARRTGETLLDAQTRRFRAKELARQIEIKVCDAVSAAENWGQELTRVTMANFQIEHPSLRHGKYGHKPVSLSRGMERVLSEREDREAKQRAEDRLEIKSIPAPEVKAEVSGDLLRLNTRLALLSLCNTDNSSLQERLIIIAEAGELAKKIKRDGAKL